MKQRLMQWMRGRYGTDALNRTLSILAILLIVPVVFLRTQALLWIGYGLLGITLFRTFSRNIPERRAELMKFMQLQRRVFRKSKQTKMKIEQRKEYKFYACPNCKKELRVPRKKGKVRITCPACHTRFEKKT